MRCRTKTLSLITFLLMIVCAIFPDRISAQKTIENWKPNIPKTWVDTEIAELEVPLANPIGSPKHIAADHYLNITVRSPRSKSVLARFEAKRQALAMMGHPNNCQTRATRDRNVVLNGIKEAM
jgi:hypothetical protein